MKRVFLIVLDGVGAGEMPDAGLYGDEGSNTLGNTARAVGGLQLPFLQSLGLGNIIDIEGVERTSAPMASWGRMRELSKGKDTITGHWEMMGILTDTPFPTYPNGFPADVIAEFERLTGRRVLCNRAASGTEVIKEFGPEHMKTGALIVYTSADSVFQIAAHEGIVPLEELYRICKIARAMLVAPNDVCRIIARPFIGPPFERTARRKDFPLPPPRATVLDALKSSGITVMSVGKVMDMFNGNGFSGVLKYAGNRNGMAKIDELMASMGEGLVFANLVDFDTQYGHRNDPEGFHTALREFDAWARGFVPKLGEDDYMIITADHGCDPTTISTDHSREHVPVLFYNKRVIGRDLGLRDGFHDIGATICRVFGIDNPLGGKSFIY